MITLHPVGLLLIVIVSVVLSHAFEKLLGGSDDCNNVVDCPDCED